MVEAMQKPLPDVLPATAFAAPAVSGDDVVYVSVEAFARAAGCTMEVAMDALRIRDGLMLIALQGRWFSPYHRSQLKALDLDGQD